MFKLDDAECCIYYVRSKFLELAFFFKGKLGFLISNISKRVQIDLVGFIFLNQDSQISASSATPNENVQKGKKDVY